MQWWILWVSDRCISFPMQSNVLSHSSEFIELICWAGWMNWTSRKRRRKCKHKWYVKLMRDPLFTHDLRTHNAQPYNDQCYAITPTMHTLHIRTHAHTHTLGMLVAIFCVWQLLDKRLVVFFFSKHSIENHPKRNFHSNWFDIIFDSKLNQICF